MQRKAIKIKSKFKLKACSFLNQTINQHFKTKWVYWVQPKIDLLAKSFRDDLKQISLRMISEWRGFKSLLFADSAAESHSASYDDETAESHYQKFLSWPSQINAHKRVFLLICQHLQIDVIYKDVIQSMPHQNPFRFYFRKNNLEMRFPIFVFIIFQYIKGKKKIL